MTILIECYKAEMPYAFITSHHWELKQSTAMHDVVGARQWLVLQCYRSASSIPCI